MIETASVAETSRRITAITPQCLTPCGARKATSSLSSSSGVTCRYSLECSRGGTNSTTTPAASMAPAHMSIAASTWSAMPAANAAPASDPANMATLRHVATALRNLSGTISPTIAEHAIAITA